MFLSPDDRTESDPAITTTDIVDLTQTKTRLPRRVNAGRTFSAHFNNGVDTTNPQWSRSLANTTRPRAHIRSAPTDRVSPRACSRPRLIRGLEFPPRAAQLVLGLQNLTSTFRHLFFMSLFSLPDLLFDLQSLATTRQLVVGVDALEGSSTQLCQVLS